VMKLAALQGGKGLYPLQPLLPEHPSAWTSL
jgi:hypothetical protein